MYKIQIDCFVEFRTSWVTISFFDCTDESVAVLCEYSKNSAVFVIGNELENAVDYAYINGMYRSWVTQETNRSTPSEKYSYLVQLIFVIMVQLTLSSTAKTWKF